MISVTELDEGIVIDHITAGQGYKIFKQLGLDELDAVVVLLRNVNSHKLGKKDIIKIETDLDVNLDVLGLIDPGATVSYVRDGKCTDKIHVSLPAEVTGILTCKNPRCISRDEHITDVKFTLVDPQRKEYACEYCESRARL